MHNMHNTPITLPDVIDRISRHYGIPDATICHFTGISEVRFIEILRGRAPIAAEVFGVKSLVDRLMLLDKKGYG